MGGGNTSKPSCFVGKGRFCRLHRTFYRQVLPFVSTRRFEGKSGELLPVMEKIDAETSPTPPFHQRQENKGNILREHLPLGIVQLDWHEVKLLSQTAFFAALVAWQDPRRQGTFGAFCFLEDSGVFFSGLFHVFCW